VKIFTLREPTPKPRPRALWISPDLFLELKALCDYQESTIKAVVERSLKRTIKEAIEKQEHEPQ
jgi:hypothetical protein